MSNIDWNFIKTLEGNNLVGKVPDAEGSKSGVTIASGFDLGARNLADLSGLPEEIINILKPFLGFKGAEAEEIAGNLRITSEQAEVINEFSKKEATELLSKRWKKATGTEFSELPMNKATVIASVAFQYGKLEKETPNFWRQVTNDDWGAAVKNLRNFGDRTPTRRNKEANYFEATEPKESLESKKFERELARDKQYGIQQAMLSGEEGGLGSEPTSTDRVITPEAPTQEAVRPTQETVLSTVPPDVEARKDRVSRLSEAMFPEGEKEQEVIQEAADVGPVEPTISPHAETVPDASASQEVSVPVDITGSNTVADFDVEGGRISKINKPQPPPVQQQDMTIADVNKLIQQDIEFAGPITQAITREQFGTAAPVLFTDNTSEVYGAAFRQLNPVLALRDVVSSFMAGIDDDPSYDPFSDPRLKKHPDSMWRFYDSTSEAETIKRLERLHQEFEDQTILQNSFSTGHQIVAALTSPSTAAPVAPLKYMKSTSALNRFIAGGAFSGAVIGGEQAVLTAAKEDHDSSHAMLAIGLSMLIGGSINSAFGNKIAQGVELRRAYRDAKAEEAFGGGGYYKSAGAAVNPETLRTQAYQFIEDEALRETGIKAEKIPYNPVLRMLKSSNPFVRALASEMVDLGGLIQKKVDKGIAQTVSVESKFNSTYISGLVQALREIDEQFLAARGVVAAEGDIRRSAQVMYQQGKDFFNRLSGRITNYEFRVRVGKAMTRGGRDSVQDAMTPYVEAAAKSARRHYDFVGNAAKNAGLFERQILSALTKAKALGQVERIAVLEARLEKIRTEGLFTNTAESYLNRIYRIDRIMAEPERFRGIIRQWGAGELNLVGRDLDQYVDDMFDSITRSKPYQAADEIDGMFEDVSVANSARMREFEIPDELIEDFLERDIEVLIRHHTKQMGMDVEIHKAFGSVDMRGVIKSVEDEFARLMDNTTDPVKKESLRKEMISTIKDIRGLRDRLRGTYGAAKDPHAMSSRFVRTMKSFNVLVGMGGATISSIPDLARIVMVEGFKNTWHYGLRNSFRQNADLLRKLKTKELRMAGVAADASLGLRAAAFADVGDVFGNRMALERIVNGSTGVMFMINGLNMWNQFLKEFSGNVTSLRMSDGIMKPWRSLSKRDREKFLVNGIDESMHRQMQEMITEFGEQVDGFWMPNTDLWTNQQARLTYRAALNQQVNRIIVTPGAGDRALWTSTELGSLITQFKSYGQAATTRLLISGLQERDQAFWQGAFLLVGLGAMVNEIKRLQYGIDKKESFDQKLVNAIERSGITGWFMEPINIIEKFSNNNLGLAPLLGERPVPMPFGAKMGAAFGPAGSNLVNIAEISRDFLGGNVDQKTMESLKFVTPGASLPVFGSLVDRAYGIN